LGAEDAEEVVVEFLAEPGPEDELAEEEDVGGDEQVGLEGGKVRPLRTRVR
jgi:hypothetical protein